MIEHWANRDDLGTALQLGWVPPTPLYLARALFAKRKAQRLAAAAKATASDGGSALRRERAPAVGVEELDLRGVEDDLDLLAVLGLRAGVQARDDV